MINTAFQYLAESYPRADSTELTRLARDYEYSRGKEILDIAAIAADVSVDSILNLQLEPEKNEELWEAFDLFTKKGQAILQHLSRDEVMGYLNGVKGKYFEVLVKNRLNDGRGDSFSALKCRCTNWVASGNESNRHDRFHQI